ncbi:MAG: MFS transporter [Haloarcula sp.]
MVFFINLARVVFAPLIEPIRATTGASDATLGLLATMVWAGSALPRLPTGILLTRVPRAKVIVGAGVVLVLGTTFTALAFDPALLLVGAFTMGLASGVYLIAANTLVSELYPSRPGRALGQHGVAAQLAAVGAPALISFVLIIGSWRTALQGMAVAATLMTVVFTLIVRNAELPDAGSEDRDLLGAARAQWHIIATSVAAIGVAGLVWNGLFNFYVTYAKSVGLTSGTGRTLLLLAFGAGVPAFYVSGRLADRLPSVPYLLAVLTAFTGCVMVLPFLTGFWSLAAFSVVVGYVIHSLFPAVDTYLLGSLPDRHRASAYATYGAGMMVLQAPGSALVGGLLDAGVAFPTLLRGMGVALLTVLVAMVSLHLNGRLPSAAEA